MGHAWDRYQKTAYMEEGNIKKDPWISRRARSIENKKYSGIVGTIKKSRDSSKY
jgi:hypothetical protein